MTSSFKPVEEYSKNLNGDLKGKRSVVLKTVIDEIEDEYVKKTHSMNLLRS